MRISMRGLGAGLPPGNSCYDATHDPGDIHCASVSDVIASIFSSQPETTTCSQQELSCLASNPNAAVTGDVCTQAVGLSCSTLILMGVGLTALIFISRAMK